MPKHTKKKLFGGGRKLRKNSPMRIFTDARAIHALGSVTAVDLFTGNRDRLLQFNSENLIVSPYSLSMIDNVWMGPRHEPLPHGYGHHARRKQDRHKGRRRPGHVEGRSSSSAQTGRRGLRQDRRNEVFDRIPTKAVAKCSETSIEQGSRRP